LSGWSGSQGSPAVVSDVRRSGGYSLRCSSTFSFAYEDLPDITETVLDFYVRFGAPLESPGDQIVFGALMQRPWAWLCAVGLANVGGTVQWLASNAGSVSFSTMMTNPSMNTWYHVQLRVKCSSAGNGEIRLFVNGIELTDLTMTSITTTYASISRASVGMVYCTGWSSTDSIWIDDVTIENIEQPSPEPPPIPANGFNMMWMQDADEILSKPNVTVALQQLKNGNFKSIGLCVGAWTTPTNPDYPLGWRHGEVTARQKLKQFISVVKAFDSSIIIFCCAYGGDTAYGPVDVSTATRRQNMSDAVRKMLNLGFDGYIDDTEEWTGTDSDIVAWWNLMADTCRNMEKISGVYYRVYYPYTHEEQILPNLTADYVVARFDPTSANADTMLERVKSLTSRLWLAQLRNIYTSGETIQFQIDWYNQKFAAGYPSNFSGFTMWTYNSMDETEWALWNSWALKNLSTNTPSYTAKPLAEAWESLVACIAVLTIRIRMKNKYCLTSQQTT
jgi:hypothetical protein